VLTREAGQKDRQNAYWEPRRIQMSIMRKLMMNEKGATAIEYGLIAALIAVAAITAMGALGSSISATLNDASAEMATARNNN
jgi:pilus assembly protein Flp/PilA